MSVSCKMSNEHVYLEFSVKSLKVLHMWPQDDAGLRAFVKQNCITIILTVTLLPMCAEIVTQFKEDTMSLGNIIESVIALTALLGVIYISFCFIRDKEAIKALVLDLVQFEHFSPMSLIRSTEQRGQFYTKLFMFYGFVGNFCYGLMPFLNYNECQESKMPHMLKYGIPCGLVTSLVLPFRYDKSPLKEMVAVTTVVECLLATIIIMAVTMLACGVLMHITSHLQRLQELIGGLSSCSDQELNAKIRFCVRFHIALINYAKRTDACFNKMMLLHFTWTGFVISVLGFKIVMTDNIIEVIRFGMHLAGWLGLLFIVCHFGQTLMDQSSQVADAIYGFAWYEKPVSVQKYVILMLVRSQKPLTMSVIGLKIMSLSTFIGILYSAYSYFTLLLKLKP